MLQEAIAEHDKLVEGDLAKSQEAQGCLKEKTEELAALKEELDEKTAELSETREAEIEMNKLEAHQKIPVDNQKRLKHWQQEVGSWNRKASSMAINTGRKPPVRY